MDEPRDDPVLQRAARWFDATPLELAGLAVLLAGALAVSAVLWWDASGRPERPYGPTGGEGSRADVAELVLDADRADRVDGNADASGTGADAADRPADPPAEQPATLTVHVTGAVGEPGVVVVPGGSRVSDAVLAAGGLASEAATELINLARPLADGEHVHVPRPGEEPPPTSSPGTGGGTPAGAGHEPGSDLVDLNTASAEDLETLPGIGPAKAAAIVRHRETHGAFRVPGDLRDVAGIGEATFQGLADRVTVR